MSRIAIEAGVSKGTLHIYFTGKADLFSNMYTMSVDGLPVLSFKKSIEHCRQATCCVRIGRRCLKILLS